MHQIRESSTNQCCLASGPDMLLHGSIRTKCQNLTQEPVEWYTPFKVGIIQNSGVSVGSLAQIDPFPYLLGWLSVIYTTALPCIQIVETVCTFFFWISSTALQGQPGNHMIRLTQMSTNNFPKKYIKICRHCCSPTRKLIIANRPFYHFS